MRPKSVEDPASPEYHTTNLSARSIDVRARAAAFQPIRMRNRSLRRVAVRSQSSRSRATQTSHVRPVLVVLAEEQDSFDLARDDVADQEAGRPGRC